jgi:two-component system chemotaxis sensor kinase CheA
MTFTAYGAHRFLDLAVGLTTLGFTALLVYFIRNNAKQLAALAAHNVSLEQHGAELAAQLSQRTNDLNVLAESAACQRDELDIVSAITRISVGEFNEFVASAARFTAANRSLLINMKAIDASAFVALIRNMRTVKGNARTLLFTHITATADTAGQTYDSIWEDPNTEWNLVRMLAELAAVESAVARYVKVSEERLGRTGRAWGPMTARGSFVSNEQLAEIKVMAAALAAGNADPDLVKLETAANRLGLVSLSDLLSSAAPAISAVAAELNKPTPIVRILDCDIGFNNPFAETLKTSLLHILRNALDQGIEDTLTRKRAKKPVHGTVSFVCERHGDHLELHIGDDGRGLALHKLYEKGLADGIFNPDERPTPEVVADVIFRSGLSTADLDPRVSGRMVGMDMVRAFLKERGATLRIALADCGTEFEFTPFEFVIDLPRNACYS